MRSIVGRFLEHSRIFRFGPRDGPAEYLIGSADLMPRNLDRRIEALLTVTGPTLQARLDEILEVGLADDVGAWELDRRRHVAQGAHRHGRRAAATAPGARARPRCRPASQAPDDEHRAEPLE